MSTIDLMKSKHPDFLKASLAGTDGEFVVLPVGRMLWPAFFTPVRPSKGETDPKKVQYSVTVLVPRVADITALQDRIQAIFEENVPVAQRKAMKWRNPITTTEAEMPDMADEYGWVLRTNSKLYKKDGTKRSAPIVRNPSSLIIKEDPGPDVLTHGRWGRVVINPYWYPAAQGSAGISLGLVNAQWLWKDTNDTPVKGGQVDVAEGFSAVEGIDDDLVTEGSFD